MQFQLILGGPGTGKTEHLIQLVEDSLKDGLRANEVAFVSFTRAATDEARGRAAGALGVSERRLPYFRTLHSLCFRQLGLQRGDVLEGESMRELEKLSGEKAKRNVMDGDAGPWEIDQLARARCIDPIELANHMDMDLFRFRRAIDTRDQFKKQHGLVDFTDMLEQYVQYGEPIDVKFAIIDEVQDLTELQWKVIHKAFGNVSRVVAAGDDDQCIHEWAGSTIRPMIEHKDTPHILHQSHRLPKKIHFLSQQILGQLHVRRSKETYPNDEDGEIHRYDNPDQVPLELPGSWLMLARARYQLDELAECATFAGVPFMWKNKSSVNQSLLKAAIEYEKNAKPDDLRWHDALVEFPIEQREYLLACRRNDEKLNVTPRISIDTAHGAKGRQADNVLVMADSTKRIWERSLKDPDSELRVLYVALTRARKTLHIVDPRSLYGWRI